jgi:PAS domain S-box-containing protein
VTPEPRTHSLQDGGTLRDFITRIEQGIYIVTPDGRVVDANPALLQIFAAESLQHLQQYRSEQLVVDPAVLAERRRLLAERGWIRDFRYEIRCLDGSTRKVKDTVFAQRDDAGNVAALHGILDVVEETEAAATDAPLSAFFTGAPAGLAILDADLRFVRINRRLAEMHLLPEAEHLGRPLAEVLPGLTPIVEPILRQVLATGTPAVNIELATEDPDIRHQARVWRFSAFPVGPARESPNGVGVVAIDITDTKRLEQQARLDGRYLAALIESSPLAMVTLDPASRIIATNHAFERLFRLSRGEAVGRDLDDLIAPTAHLDEARELTRRTQGGEQLRVDVRRRRSDGSSVVVRAHGAPIVLDGQHLGAHVIYEELEAD